MADLNTTLRGESIHAMISPQLDNSSSLLDVVDNCTQRHHFEASFKMFRPTQVVLNGMNTENLARTYGTDIMHALSTHCMSHNLSQMEMGRSDCRVILENMELVSLGIPTCSEGASRILQESLEMKFLPPFFEGEMFR